MVALASNCVYDNTNAWRVKARKHECKLIVQIFTHLSSSSGAIKVSILPVSYTFVAFPPSNLRGKNGDGTNEQYATALLSIPWNGPPESLRDINLIELEPQVALYLLENYINHYYNTTRDNKCPNNHYLMGGQLGSSSDNRSLNDPQTMLWPEKKEDEKNCQETFKGACSCTKRFCKGYFSVKIFGINLNISYSSGK
ncbi:BJ4_G0052710.mRNA.1.CDS.1 [Saccharomyces cerevisiae]|nr:BJ4_G0052710.mRNA.1.CDS.1 [Saccharomyces cerevisiae]